MADRDLLKLKEMRKQVLSRVTAFSPRDSLRDARGQVSGMNEG